MTRRYSKRKSMKKPWITRKGKLGGRDFLTKSIAEQHRLLDNCVRNYGYKSCLGSVQVLSRSRSIKRRHGPKINSLKHYLMSKYSLKKK